MKNKILLLLYGFVLVLVWGICFLGKGMSDAYTAALGLSFTFISSYLVQKEYHFSLDIWDKTAIALFPFLYIIAVYFVLFKNGSFSAEKFNLYQNLFYHHLINPLNVAFVGLWFGLTKLKDLTKPLNAFVFTYIILFHSYFFHSNWLSFWLGSQVKNFGVEKSSDRDELNVNQAVNIYDFQFINPDLDTVTLTNEKSRRYILVETWSENCLPCIRAMNELPDFYMTIQDRVDVYYVYENQEASTRKKFDKIFRFESVQDKSKILIDINQNLYNSLGMSGFPYFLLFDPNGKLIYYQRGYPGKKMLTQDILERL